MTSKVVYRGKLKSEATHLDSGSKIITDAPKDNYGNGEAFSPTDLLATSLANCMISIMGIVAIRDNHTSIDGTICEVTKVMLSNPRRVGEIHVKVIFPKNNFSDKEKIIYQNAALTCPVAKSLHPEIKQEIIFEW